MTLEVEIMSKTIEFTHNGKDFCLEFTRQSVKRMEENGFNFEELTSKPVSLFFELFKGSFLAHHKFVKSKEIEEILDLMKNRHQLQEKLMDMYTDTLTSLLDDNDEEQNEDNSNLIEWA